MIFGFLFNIACICAGILLAITHLDRLDGTSDFFNNIAAKLRPLSATIGITTIIIGIIFLFSWHCIIYALIGIICGIILLPQKLAKIPGIGDELYAFSGKMKVYQVLFGDAALILGILSLLGWNPLC